MRVVLSLAAIAAGAWFTHVGLDHAFHPPRAGVETSLIVGTLLAGTILIYAGVEWIRRAPRAEGEPPEESFGMTFVVIATAVIAALVAGGTFLYFVSNFGG